MRNQHGTTLVEVLVALAIVGIVGSGLIMGMTMITKTTPNVDEKVTALGLAESQMEYVKNQQYGWSYDKIDTPQNMYIASPIAIQFDANSDGVIDAADDFIQKLEVKIWVPEANGGSKVVIALEDYRTL